LFGRSWAAVARVLAIGAQHVLISLVTPADHVAPVAELLLRTIITAATGLGDQDGEDAGCHGGVPRLVAM
jgi:hypothetical protein